MSAEPTLLITRDAAGGGEDLGVLFEPCSLGGLRLKNRIVMAPMGTALDEGGHITDAAIAYYRRRAKGGVGTIVVEGCLVSPAAEGPEPRIHGREYLPGLTKLVEELRPYDVTIGVQLMHPGRQVLSGPRVAPSPIPLHRGAPVPEELTRDGIVEAIEQYAAATAIAREAGFDFVEVHGAHGYLPSNFLAPRLNRREDEYGGTLEGRARFCREVARAILAASDGEMPLVWRINGDDSMDGGLHVDEAACVCRWLEEDGVAAISVSSGTWHTLEVTLAPMYVPRGHMIPLAAAIKRAVGIPVMAVGRLDDAHLAARVVDEGSADLICLGRGLIADPDWPAKVRDRQLERVRPCIACNVCVDLVGRGEPARCAVNSEVGQELTWRLEPAARRRRVMVVGSGPAGLEAARIARIRGHDVSIWERDGRLGGKLEVAALAPSKHEVLRARDYQERVLGELGVEIHLGVEVSPEVVERERPDVVLVAVGAVPLVPPIPGIDAPHVADAQAFLRGEVAVAAGERVAIVGGSATGCETAELLVARGVAVTVLDMLPSIGHGIEGITRRHLVRELERSGVRVLTRARVTAIEPGRVLYVRAGETAGEEVEEVPVERVALALGWLPRGSELAERLDGPEVVVIGDAGQPGDFAAAINSAAHAALSL